jgi:hypothetical protein
MKNTTRFTLCVIFLLSLTACRSQATKHSTTFNIPNVSSALTYRSDWETPPLNEEKSKRLNAILDQEFTYIGKGAQCWAFVSADNKHVIKFFKHYRLHLPEDKDYLERTFRSYKIAYELLRPETGIVYVHLNKTESLHKTITVRDERGHRHSIDVDNMEFLIQKKGARVYPTFKQLMSDGKVKHAKRLLSSIIQLVITCADKGIKVRDPLLRKNGGFFRNQAVFLDVGSFVPDNSLKSREGHKGEVVRVMRKIMPWLQDKYPELAEYVAREVESL